MKTFLIAQTIYNFLILFVVATQEERNAATKLAFLIHSALIIWAIKLLWN